MKQKNWELKLIFWIIDILFAAFLVGPILLLLGKSMRDGGLTLEFYSSVVSKKGFLAALGNSFIVAAVSAVLATVIAFLMAYTVHYTGLPKWFKRVLTGISTLPMFLPTITYGFAILYAFGKQIIIYSNADEEAITAMQNAQGQNKMFPPLTFDVNTMIEVPDYTAPITSQEGAIILNTELIAEENLPAPTCLKDLADPICTGHIAVTDIQSSSTAWLLIPPSPMSPWSAARQAALF